MMIRMLDTKRGSSDGFAVHQFHKGCFYIVGEELGESLAKSFLRAKVAEIVNQHVVEGLIKSPYFNGAFHEMEPRRASIRPVCA